MRASFWRKYHGSIIPWNPPHLNMNLTKERIYLDIKANNSYFARWTTDFDSKKSSFFWYIINDKKLNFNDYSKNTKSKINRGLKKLTAKIISKEELILNGYSVYEKALKRYAVVLKKKTEIDFFNEINNLDKSWQFWGIYCNKSDRLVAFSLNRIVNDYCDYSTVKFDPDYLKDYSSYVLYYSMNKYYLNENRFRYVNNGTRSISHQTNIHAFLIDKFKFRKAYCNIQVLYSPIFKIIVQLFYPIRFLFPIIPLDFFRKIHVVLYQEEIRILCSKIYNLKIK